MRLLTRTIPLLLAMVLALAMYAHFHYLARRAALRLAAAAPKTQPAAAQPDAAAGLAGADQNVSIVGPLADYMRDKDPKQNQSADALASASQGPDAAATGVPYVSTAQDRVSHTPLGPGGEIVPANFSVSNKTVFSFDVPPHATHPRLVGAFRSRSAKQGSPANVDFLLLTAAQFASLSHGTLADALFSSQASHGQNIDLALPITGDTSVRYYIVFLGDDSAKRVINAALRLELNSY